MSKPNLPEDNTFCISFETHDPNTGKPHAGYIKTVSVTLQEGVMDVQDTAWVNLPDHPLYPMLEQFVLANRTINGDGGKGGKAGKGGHHGHGKGKKK